MKVLGNNSAVTREHCGIFFLKESEASFFSLPSAAVYIVAFVICAAPYTPRNRMKYHTGKKNMQTHILQSVFSVCTFTSIQHKLSSFPFSCSFLYIMLSLSALCMCRGCVTLLP
jgi:hypothetical protein